MKKIFALFLFLSLSTRFSIAQDTIPGPNELDKLYTPGKNAIFNGAGSDKGSPDNSSGFTIHNSVKVNPTFFLRNTMALFYERWFGPLFSLQLGLGYLYDIDQIFALTADVGMDLYDYSSDVSLSTIMESGTKTNGPSLYKSLATRFYFNNYYSNGNSYIELSARHSSINMEIRNNAFIGKPLVSVKSYSFILAYGYQFVTNGKLKTTHDFYGGAGARRTSFDSFEQKYYTIYNNSGYNYYNNYDETVYYYAKTGMREAMLSPVVVFGYCFGFGF
jgi:hypothetical protein